LAEDRHAHAQWQQTEVTIAANRGISDDLFCGLVDVVVASGLYFPLYSRYSRFLSLSHSHPINHSFSK